MRPKRRRRSSPLPREADLLRGVLDEGDLFASTLTADDMRGFLG
jgi:hypothetical protein